MWQGAARVGDSAVEGGAVIALYYWKHKNSTALHRAIDLFLCDEPMTDDQIAVVREYFRQWIEDPAWDGPKAKWLRAEIDNLKTHDALFCWRFGAKIHGMDPI